MRSLKVFGLVVILVCAGLGSGFSATARATPVVLVTGFVPFGNYSVNPSEEIVEALNGTMIDGAVIVGVVLPVNFTQAMEEAKAAIDRYAPVLVISTGLNARLHGRVAVEHQAVNLRQRPRANGHWVPPAVLMPGGPLVRRASIPVEKCMCSLRAGGVPVQGSWWAGTYVCNAVFYGELDDVAGSGIRVGFVHVPLLDSQNPEGLSLSMMVVGVQDVVSVCLSSGC